MGREAPEPWAGWMRDAGVVDPRGRVARASMSELAKRVGVTPTTIIGMIFGDRHTDPATVADVADVLGVDVRTVSAQVGQARTVRDPYRVPDEVHLLPSGVQAALTRLIKAIAEESVGNAQHPAAKSRAGDAGARVIDLPVSHPDFMLDAADDRNPREEQEERDE